MVEVPDATPVTVPAGSIVTAAVLLLCHVPMPLAVTSDNGAVEPIHTDDDPVIVPATGNGLTVTVAVAVAVPQELKDI